MVWLAGRLLTGGGTVHYLEHLLMIELPRRFPDFLPELHPVPEYRVTGSKKHWYEEMKRCLGVYDQLVGLCPAGRCTRRAVRTWQYGPPSVLPTDRRPE